MGLLSSSQNDCRKSSDILTGISSNILSDILSRHLFWPVVLTVFLAHLLTFFPALMPWKWILILLWWVVLKSWVAVHLTIFPFPPKKRNNIEAETQGFSLVVSCRGIASTFWKLGGGFKCFLWSPPWGKDSICFANIWVFPRMRGTPKWMVYNGKPY